MSLVYSGGSIRWYWVLGVGSDQSVAEQFHDGRRMLAFVGFCQLLPMSLTHTRVLFELLLCRIVLISLEMRNRVLVHVISLPIIL
jgi:hypothetical protein